jgi:hypothetical protein
MTAGSLILVNVAVVVSIMRALSSSTLGLNRSTNPTQQGVPVFALDRGEAAYVLGACADGLLDERRHSLAQELDGVWDECLRRCRDSSDVPRPVWDGAVVGVSGGIDGRDVVAEVVEGSCVEAAHAAIADNEGVHAGTLISAPASSRRR